MPLVIDSDSHVAEARDLWTDRMSRDKWGDLIPEVRWDAESSTESWYVGTHRLGPVGICSYAVVDPETGGRRRWEGTYPDLPARFEDMHPSSYDPQARLDVMDEYGIYASMLYPNFNFVVTDVHSTVSDPAFKLDTITAYNDWLIEWCSRDSRRLIPLALVPYHDVEAAAKEVYRARELGHRGLVMTGAPEVHGQPFLPDRHWDPLWEAAQETRMPVSFHVGGGDISGHLNEQRLAVEGGEAMAARGTTALLFDNAIRFNDLMLSGILPRFADLKFVCVETGMGWVNFSLESADYHFVKANVAKARPEFEELPSFYFHRQVYTTYWFEKLYPFHVERLGAGNILFETDFPHHTCLETDEVKWVIDEGLALVGDDVKERVLWKNAAELYDLETPAAGAR